ncbi:protein CMSS1 isoform X4 [Hydra vulgaris]|uniref:Protein CMSS1 isoform X4 n=1 Tax=Hydra vulgaris TaxID=6087 RepID=A0ABM4BLM9_HYDVU
MADDLGDDWWENTEIVSKEKNDQGSVKATKSKKIKRKVSIDKNDGDTKIRKRKRKLINEQNCELEKEAKKKKSNNNIVPVAKKKQKKKKLTTQENTLAPNVESLWAYFEKELGKTLSCIELEDIKPDHDSWVIGEDSPKVIDENFQLSSYLKTIVPNWEKVCKKVQHKPGSPVMLIITSGGQRAADLLRKASDFRGENCKSMKLFAKHFKINEQADFLNKNVIHLGVGTPNRVAKLIELGNLSIKHLSYIVIDWTWKDDKKRSIWNMHGVKDDFLELFQKYILPKCKSSKAYVGLF